jgi:4-amino-4-deoxychorismate lyase
MGGSLVESALRAGAGQPGLKLIETLAWDGAVLLRLPRHMARLQRSAQALGWPCDLAQVEAALGRALPANPARIRLTLDAMGQTEVQTADLPARKSEWRIGLASARLSSNDPWLGVKSTNRQTYDTARAALPAGLDEVIFQNQRGEICDGTITTVFFDRGQGMRTPPLSCGLLPGVLRAEMAVLEEVLLARDLPQVRLWVGNSLRGLIPAIYIL